MQASAARLGLNEKEHEGRHQELQPNLAFLHPMPSFLADGFAGRAALGAATPFIPGEKSRQLLLQQARGHQCGLSAMTHCTIIPVNSGVFPDM